MPALAALALGSLAGGALAASPLIALGGLAGLVGVVGILLSPRFGLATVIGIAILLPFGTLPFRAVITPTLLSLALVSALGVLLLRILANPDERLDLTPLGLPLIGFLGLTLFAFLLGSQLSPDATTLHNFAKFVLAVLSFVLVVNTVRTRADTAFMLRVLILAGAVAALLGLVLYALNDATALRLLVSLGRIGYPIEGRVLRYIEAGAGTGTERAIGLAVDPNAYGGMLALMLALSAAQLVAPQPILRRPVLAMASGLMALALFLTYSRAALGGVVVAAMYIATVRYRRLWWLILAGGALAAMAIVVLGFGDEFAGRVVEGVQFRDQANQMRLAEYRNAIAIIARYPVFGIGFGAAPDLDLNAGVSSIYLAIAQRTGLVGLAAFLALIVLFFSLSWRAMRHADDVIAAQLVGFQAGIAAALAVGLLDHYFFNIEFSHMVALFWMVIGLALAIARWLSAPAEPHRAAEQ